MVTAVLTFFWCSGGARIFIEGSGSNESKSWTCWHWCCWWQKNWCIYGGKNGGGGQSSKSSCGGDRHNEAKMVDNCEIWHSKNSKIPSLFMIKGWNWHSKFICYIIWNQNRKNNRNSFILFRERPKLYNICTMNSKIYWCFVLLIKIHTYINTYMHAYIYIIY